MRHTRVIVSIVISALLYLPLAAAEPAELKSGVVYGPSHAFLIEPAEGWVLDNTSGVPNGLHAVFYPAGSSWEESSAVMYAQGSRRPKDKGTFEEFIQRDIEQFRRRNPKLRVRELETAITGDKKQARVREFDGEGADNIEAVAYIEEKSAFAVLVLSAKTREAYENTLPAFRKFVGSYKFISDDVKIEAIK